MTKHEFPEYSIWGAMIQRCTNPNRGVAYKNNAAVGVVICPVWRNSFESFYADVGPRPSSRHTFELIDRSQGYKPGNVHWFIKVRRPPDPESHVKRNKTDRRGHGFSRTREYRIWAGMIQRCTNTSVRSYKDYGGRGVTVCSLWRRSFIAFLAHVGLRPNPKHTLERKDNNKGYEPGNVHWILGSKQSLNTRRSVRLVIDGESKTGIEWARLSGISQFTIYDALKNGRTEKIIARIRKAVENATVQTA